MAAQRVARPADGRSGGAGRPGRITAEESFLDLIDQIAYGDLDAWRRIYAAAQKDAAVRQAVIRAAGLVEPEYASAGELWRTLVGRMPPLEPRHEAVATLGARLAGASAAPSTRRAAR